MFRKLKLRAYNLSVFAELSNIIPASEYKPSWWKQQTPFLKSADLIPPNKGIDNRLNEWPIPTVKMCPAIHTQFQAGYIITAPFDMEIVADDDVWSLNFNSNLHSLLSKESLEDIFSSHPNEQYSSLHNRDESPYVPSTLKINTGYQLVSDKPVNVMVIPPYWSHVSLSDNIVCLPATLQLSSEIYPADMGHGLVPNFLVKKNSRTFIAKGDPLLQIIPFPQQSVDVAESSVLEEDKHIIFSGMVHWKRVLNSFSHTRRNFLSRFMFKNKYTKSTIDSKPWIIKFKKLFPHLKSHKSHTVDKSKITK